MSRDWVKGYQWSYLGAVAVGLVVAGAGGQSSWWLGLVLVAVVAVLVLVFDRVRARRRARSAASSGDDRPGS